MIFCIAICGVGEHTLTAGQFDFGIEIALVTVGFRDFDFFNGELRNVGHLQIRFNLFLGRLAGTAGCQHKANQCR